MHKLSVIGLYYTEMPTSGNLKSGDSLFGIYYYEVLHEVQNITIRFCDCNGEIIFVSDEICAKMPQKLNYESEKIQILG